MFCLVGFIGVAPTRQRSLLGCRVIFWHKCVWEKSLLRVIRNSQKIRRVPIFVVLDTSAVAAAMVHEDAPS